MCGIAGMFRFDHQPAEAAVILKMTDRMAHRGPDATGCYTDGPAGLGHRRLSIIDLSEASNQPIADNSGRYQIIFNGEIYNYREVKSLITGYQFKTSGDTEVLLAAYAKWGPACLDYLKGMFVFIIWDMQKQEMFIARDRMGVKPVYYFQDSRVLVFASEIRAILQSGLVKPIVNKTALSEFLGFQSIGGTLSAIKEVNQLPAGSYMVVNQGGATIHKYWHLTDAASGFDFSNRQAVKTQIRKLLRDAVERRMVSDVPLGAFLSGGIDSSAVVGLMAEVSDARPNTFTIGFEEKDFDESGFADVVARKFNTRHHRIVLKPGIFLEELENALSAMDTPSGDGINTYVVSKAIRQNGMTVALSGMGGDELFAGYPFFQQFLKLKKFEQSWRALKPLRHAGAAILAGRKSNKADRIQELLRASENSISHFYPEFRRVIGPRLLNKLTILPNHLPVVEQELLGMENELNAFPLLSQVSIADYTGYTQHTLLKDTDQMSMASSLEVREPFFDHDLVSFVLHVPDEIKNGAYQKSLLVESLNGLLPDAIVHRPKQGFLFPWKHWMKNELKDFCQQHINRICERDFIQADSLRQYWRMFLEGDQSVRWMELWLFVILEYWMEKNHIG